MTHWETLLGRGKNCDLVLDYPTISRSHAVLTRYDDGSWSISDVGSKGGVEVNGTAVRSCALEYGDTISLGGVKVTLVPFSREQEYRQAAGSDTGGPSDSSGHYAVLPDAVSSVDHDAAVVPGETGGDPHGGPGLWQPDGAAMAAVLGHAGVPPYRL